MRVPSRRRTRNAITTAMMLAAVALLVSSATASATSPAGAATRHARSAASEQPLTIEGESPADTNIPTASDPRASGGAYLALETSVQPGPQGWYATYGVDVDSSGIYELQLVATSPLGVERSQTGSSYFNLSVNGNPYTQVAKSAPAWASFDKAHAWGELYVLRLDDTELRSGHNTISLMVDQRRVMQAPAIYRFFLDRIILTPTDVALKDIRVGDPATNVGTYRGPSAELQFALNAHAPETLTVDYRVTDYFANSVEQGSVTVPEGATSASVALSGLPPGNYRVVGSLRSPHQDEVVGYFARLPTANPIAARDNRFGINTAAAELVPSSRIEAFAAAMQDAGAGYVRDQLYWPVAEPERDVHYFDQYNDFAAAFLRRGLRTVTYWGFAGGAGLGVSAGAPTWARSGTSPLPADLRDAYDFAKQLAKQSNGAGAYALESWSEPDLGSDSTTGDQHAAYTKAAMLGMYEGSRRVVRIGNALVPLTESDRPNWEFQQLLMQNDVARYADVSNFHGYAFDAGHPDFPAQSDLQRELSRTYDAGTQTWMTESGIFLPGQPEPPDEDVSPDRQREQAQYLVRSSVQDLAAGTDKHFWFSGMPFDWDGSGLYFGALNRKFQPLPSYSAHAAMTSILGKADFVQTEAHLPAGVSGYTFRSDDRVITVAWSAEPQTVSLPVYGRDGHVYNIMGDEVDRRGGPGGRIEVKVTQDPVYLVSQGARGLPKQRDDQGPRARPRDLSPAEHIVLSQQWGPDNQAPMKPADATGYRLDETTTMSLEIYNFNPQAQTVTVAPHVWGGWSITPRLRRVSVPGFGREAVEFTVSATGGVKPGVDYPIVFDAGLSSGNDVPPSVGRIQLKGGTSGSPILLSPTISDVSPSDGTTVVGPRVQLQAETVDALSGIDPGRVTIEVDGVRVRSRFDPASGRLTASLNLRPGRHVAWIRAYDNAHAPSATSVSFTVERRGR